MSDMARKRGIISSSDQQQQQQDFNTTTTMEVGGSMYANADGVSLSQQQIIPPPPESHTRSLVKGLTWRCLATLTTVTIAWMVTGETGTAMQIGFFEFFAKLAIYYAHERVWTRIKM
jgi:uncharacterized membrane protein